MRAFIFIVIGWLILVMALGAKKPELIPFYMFILIVFPGLVFVAFYYLLRPGIQGNIGKGITFLILAIIAYLVGTLFHGHHGLHTPYHSYLWYQIWYDFMNSYLAIGNGVRVWQIFLIFSLFGNAIAFAKKPNLGTIIGVNFLSIMFTILMFLLFRY